MEVQRAISDLQSTVPFSCIYIKFMCQSMYFYRVIRLLSVYYRGKNTNLFYSFLDPMITLLDSSKTEEEVPHEAFKGALYVLLGHKDKTILTKHDWTTLLKVWPSLVLSRHSEKPSVSSLLDR